MEREGKKIWEQEIEKSNKVTSHRISLNKLPKGIYFVEVSQGNRKAIKKLVKE
jgi:hypothetical protein